MASELTPVPDDLDFGVTVRGLVVSQQVFGRYALRHVLGRGGMGVVWLAHDERLERDVALKFLPEAVNYDAVALDDLKRETRRCLDLTHPNIIRIYDFVKDQQAAAISMEYIDGKTLAALRIDKENRIFEVEEIQEWISKACQALYYAHEEVKVVHRDLKPANLMLTTRGQIKIADFGIARSVSDSLSQVTMRKGTSGTLVYMSPQQMNGDISRVTDDIYAIGATIYELLTSKPPFYSGDIPHQVRESTPRSMTERRHDLEITGREIPREWEDTIAACLAKKAEDRPANMMEVAERLGLATGTVKMVAPGTTKSATTKTAPKLPKEPKAPRKPFPTKLVSIIAGGVVGIALLGWVLWSFVIWPFFATPGEVLVTSVPTGATVHLKGQQNQITPADFTKVRVGKYRLTVSEKGFDPVDETVAMTEGNTINLGTVTLKRAFGKLTLTTIPPHVRYTLTGVDVTADITHSGSTPDVLPNIPAGNYQITLSESGLPSHTDSIEVPEHGALVEKSDLIKLSLSSDASPDVAKVFLGQMDAGQLDAKGKSELADLRGNAFEKYLSYRLLLPAADELNSLKGLGQDVTAKQKELTDRRASVEKEIGDQIKELIDDKKIATAALLLNNLDGTVEKESADRLKAQFQPAVAQYQQQVEAAIKISQDGPPAAAYDPLKAFAVKYPDDLNLQLALAQLQTRMPPDHDRLTAQMKAFHQFAAQNKDAAMQPDFQAMQDKFATELKTLDELAGALSEAKNGPASIRNEIASLQEQKASIQRRRVGDNNAGALADTANFFGKVVTGHDVVNSNAFYASQAQKDDQIAAVQSRIDTDQQRLSQPQGNVDDAQRRYDDFVAHVPW